MAITYRRRLMVESQLTRVIPTADVNDCVMFFTFRVVERSVYKVNDGVLPFKCEAPDEPRGYKRISIGLSVCGDTFHRCSRLT